MIPGSEIAREHLSEELCKMGAEVERISIYTNTTPEYEASHIDEVFSTPPDLVTFTSSSTVSNLVGLLEGKQRSMYLDTIRGASIGPVTSSEAARLDVDVVLEAEEHTISGLVDSILKFYDKEEKP